MAGEDCCGQAIGLHCDYPQRVLLLPVTLPISCPKKELGVRMAATDANRTALLLDDEFGSRATQLARLQGEGYTVMAVENHADDSCRHIPVVVIKDQLPVKHVAGRAKLHAVPHDSW